MTQWRRGLAWGTRALALALLLIVAAWLASNWKDVPPQPRPAELQLPQPSLPDARNAYFALAGLLAAADREPSAAGHAHWQQLLARGNTATSQRWVPDHDTPPVDVERSLGKTLPGWSGPPLLCESHVDDCVARWIETAQALHAQRDEHALIGARCERLLEGDFAFDEVLPPMQSTAEPIAQHAIGAWRCSQWFTSGAVLAWVQHDRSRAIALLSLADRMNRALLERCHSLIGQMIAIRTTRDTLGAAAALVVRDPSLAPALRPLLAPLPDPVHGIKRWMAAEAAFQRGAIAEIERAAPEQAGTKVSIGDFDLGAWLARRRVGLHPQRTMQQIDAQWLRAMAPLDGGLAAAIRAHAAGVAEAADGAGPPWFVLTWVNPLGSVLVEIGRADYGVYLARHADLELQREVTALAVDAATAGIPPAKRAAWTEQQPLTLAARERIAWSDDGLVLSARTWLETTRPGQQPQPRDAIRVAWPEAR